MLPRALSRSIQLLHLDQAMGPLYRRTAPWVVVGLKVVKTRLDQFFSWQFNLAVIAWSNRFTLGGFTVTYSTFQMAGEVIEKTEDEDRTEISHRWFKNRKAAERWCVKRMSGGC